jgi:hypothetical protein
MTKEPTTTGGRGKPLFDHHRTLQGAAPFSDEDAQDTVYGWLARQDTVLWVWQEEGQVMGLARARFDGVCFFEEFVAAEGRRGLGIGTRVLAALGHELHGAGERDVFLSRVVCSGRKGHIHGRKYRLRHAG